MLEKIEQAHKEESPSGTIDAVTFDDTFTTDDNFWDDPNMSAIFGPTQTPETASTAEDSEYYNQRIIIKSDKTCCLGCIPS